MSADPGTAVGNALNVLIWLCVVLVGVVMPLVGYRFAKAEQKATRELKEIQHLKDQLQGQMLDLEEAIEMSLLKNWPQYVIHEMP